jgi:hypothetical protein
MPLDDPKRQLSIFAPENNLRLPDAIAVEYGPARLLAPFLLAADRAARRQGVTLRVRFDFDELLYVNRHYAARGIWYPLVDGFNPECADINRGEAFWVSGEDENGEVVVTSACRIYDWAGTSLAEQARAVWYGHDRGQPCIVTAEAAQQITGLVAWGGASWVRPDFRGRHLSYLIPRVLKAYGSAHWPIRYLFCFMGAENARKGLAASYGHQKLSYSISFPGSPHGEQVVGYTRVEEFYEELTRFMATGGSVMEPGDFGGDDADADAAPVSTGLEHIVTKTSADGVFHGSISLS